MEMSRWADRPRSRGEMENKFLLGQSISELFGSTGNTLMEMCNAICCFLMITHNLEL